uniref:Uncharacterized protein n=1 Tax=Arundo donax TaxID=35708 RepID=A0A0A9CJN2_ARUDO
MGFGYCSLISPGGRS